MNRYLIPMGIVAGLILIWLWIVCFVMIGITSMNIKNCEKIALLNSEIIGSFPNE